jgi:tetratricopeptide (TPR) repeat protein
MKKQISKAAQRVAISAIYIAEVWGAASLTPTAFATVIGSTPTIAAIDGSDLKSPATQGYTGRGTLMFEDANPRGTVDQLDEALRLCPTNAAAIEKTKVLQILATMQLPGNDAMAALNHFLEEYPASPWRERVLLAIADTLYDRQEYALALQAYNNIGDDTLDRSLAEARLYRKAYCLLRLSNTKQAEPIYEQLRQSSEYANNARFYQGYIAYIQGDYSKAAELMRGVKRTGMPTVMADYYLAQISFLNSDYQNASRSARTLLSRTDDNIDPQFTAEAQRIAGESLYQLGDESAAITYLRRYVASTDAPLPSALYILGVDNYRSGLYQDAIDTLTPVTGQASSIGQSAYLYIGQAYLKLNNTNAATLALEQACRLGYDANVQETAFYNLAVAKAQGGSVPFGNSVGLFEEFLQRYPDSRFAPDVADYVITGYMTDNNYAAALQAIENIKRPTDEILAAKQQVLYTLGTRELQAGQASSALTHFTEAASLSRYNAGTAAEATLWKGEAQYKLGDYAGAVTSYTAYLKQSSGSKANRATARYDLGYAQFARKEFAAAGNAFKQYINEAPSGTSSHIIADAYNRWADTQYYTSDFSGAAATYQRAYQAEPASGDYPMYQQGLMKGLRRDHSGKIETLSQMVSTFPSSALVPSALLEMAESYGEIGSTDRAIETYTTLVNRYPSTAQGRQGQLLLAITYLNNGNRQQAITHYKRVITNYPSSDEARVAADDLKQLYADDGRLSEYITFINNVPEAPKLESGEVAQLTLTSAEKAIEKGDDTAALAHATDIVENYPDSPQAVEALAIKADVEYRQGKGPEALASYTALEQRASSASDINAARMGIMRVSRDMADYQRTIETADQLLASSTLGSSSKKEVTFTKATALYNSGKQAEALSLWQELATDIDDLYGTKSAFNIAQHYADAGNNDKALEAANRLIEANPPHDYWLARGFILLSDILRKKGDTFEADEYLRSLRENYPGTETDIFRMIDERLK